MTIFIKKGTREELLDNLRGKITELVNETSDRDVLLAAALHADTIPADDLATEVIFSDVGALSAWKNKISDGYVSLVAKILDSLDNRDVNSFTLGELACYVTGGMSSGDDPTDTFAEWYYFFHRPFENWGDEDDVEDPFREVLIDSISFYPKFKYSEDGKLYQV